jgi:hypothetical protein
MGGSAPAPAGAGAGWHLCRWGHGAVGRGLFLKRGGGARWEGGRIVFALVDLLGRRGGETFNFFPHILPREPILLHSGKDLFPRVPTVALGELIFPPFFYVAFKHCLKLLAQIWLNLEFFVIFRYFFHFLEFLAHFKTELHVHEII